MDLAPLNRASLLTWPIKYAEAMEIKRMRAETAGWLIRWEQQTRCSTVVNARVCIFSLFFSFFGGSSRCFFFLSWYVFLWQYNNKVLSFHQSFDNHVNFYSWFSSFLACRFPRVGNKYQDPTCLWALLLRILYLGLMAHTAQLIGPSAVQNSKWK